MLEAGNRDHRDGYAMKLELEGSGRDGIDDETARKGYPVPPTSPLTSAVVQNPVAKQGVAVVHRVRLRNFDEGAEGAGSRRITRRSTTGGISDGGEKELVRRSTLEPTTPEKFSDFASVAVALMARNQPRAESVGASRGSSKERAEATGARSRPSSATGYRDLLAEAPTVRNLDSQEIVKRNKDAVAWFRASRDINRNVRSIEDAETLLADARERRANGPGAQVRRKSKEIPLGEAKQEVADTQSNATPAGPAVRKRSVLDPALMYSAKAPSKWAIVKKQVEEKKFTSAMRGAVTVGGTGEDSLLSRLARRRSTIE